MPAEYYYYHQAARQRQRERQQKMFETSSIGDLAFLLLIFFIVTSSFLLRQGIFLSLPGKGAAMKVKPEQVLSVTPEKQGYLVKGSVLQEAEMVKQLVNHRQGVEKPIVLINMKSKVKYRRFVDTLSLVRENSIEKVSVKYQQ